MFKFGDSARRKPGEGLQSECVQSTGQGPGKEGVGGGCNTGVVAAGSSGLGPGGSPVLANVSQSMMDSEGGRLVVGGAFGVEGPRVFGGLATPQAIPQNHHNSFNIAGRGGGTGAGAGAGGGVGTGGIPPEAIADGGAQWGSVGGAQGQQLQQQLLMLQRFQAQQQHLQQQQQPLPSASQQQQLLAAALPAGAVPSASTGHPQMGFMIPAQMRVQMAARMAQLGSAAVDGGANGAPRGNSGGGAGDNVGLAMGAPGGGLGAVTPDTPPNFTVETPRQQDLQVQAQCQQIQQQMQLQQQQQQQQQHYQQQPTSTMKGGIADMSQKETEMIVVPASSPTLAYSPSRWETGDAKLGIQSMDTTSLNASRNGYGGNANASASAPGAASGETSHDNGGRRNNGGSDGDSVNVCREGVSEAGTKGDAGGSGGGSVGDSCGSEVNNGVRTFSTGFQAGMPQMPSNVDQGIIGSGGADSSGSGTPTADNALGMAAAVMSFYNELPGSTGVGMSASMAQVAKNTAAGAGAPGSGREGEKSIGQEGEHKSGGGSQGTGASDGTDWQQVVKPGLTSQIPATVTPGNQAGLLDRQPQQGKDGFGRQDKRSLSGTPVGGWALGAPIDGTGLVAAAAVGTVGVGTGGGSGGGVCAVQPAAAGTAGAVGMEVSKQQQAYLQAMFQARMQHQQHFQQHLQQQQFARTSQQNQMMQAQRVTTQAQQQFRLQSQQMNALFQAKQMALQQKLRAGQVTLQQAQQVSQMQQAQLVRAIQTLYVQAQAQQQQAAQIFAQQQVQQLQLHNIQQLQMIKFQQQQQQQQARALQLPAMGAPKALQPLVGSQSENQAAQRAAEVFPAPPSPAVVSSPAETSGVEGRSDEAVSGIPPPSSGSSVATNGGGGDGGNASKTEKAQGASVAEMDAMVPEASTGAGGPSVVGGGAGSDTIEAGVHPDTLKSNANASMPVAMAAAAVGVDLSSGTQPPPPSPQLPMQATLIQNFEASAAASRVVMAAASKATAGGMGATRDAVWGAGSRGRGVPMGAAVTALQQQMIMQQQQQQQMAAVIAQQQLQQQQQQQQQQQLMMVSNFPGSFAHTGVNPAPSTPSAGGASGGLNIAGQSLWPGGVGLGAGLIGPPRPPPAAAAATVATSMSFQQRQPTGFSTSTSTPTAVFPPPGIHGGVGMLGAVMGGRLGLMSSNPGNNLERQQQAAATAFNLQGANRIPGAVTDQQQQPQPQIVPQNVQPLQQQNGANSGRETEKASVGLASFVAVPDTSFVSTGVSVAASVTSDASATATAGAAATATAGVAATDAAVATSASGPTPRPWNGPVDDEDWGPEGEEEFMSMLNLAMDDEDVEMGQAKGAIAQGLDFFGWDEEEDPHLDEAQDDYDDELSAYKEDPKIVLGHGSRVRRKQFVEKLEKAKVEMAADLNARAKEDQLALKLREQWRQKMRDIALAILRRWWSAGDAKKSCRTKGGGNIRGEGGECSDSRGEESWQDLLTDDAVAVAPVESGRVEISVCSNVTSGGEMGTAPTARVAEQGAAVIPSARVRAKETRLEGLAAVRAEVERLRVMTETLGYPTPLGNLKLKFDVHVDHWSFGERELMCQWRASTRNAALCGGRWELETRGMMSLYMWTSEDGEAPSVEPKSKASTWAILRSPADRTESPYSQPSLQQPQPPQKATSSLTSPLSDARREPGLAIGASPAVAPVSTVASTLATATGSGPRRTKACQGASGVKRSRQDMETGTAVAATGDALSVADGSKRACNTGCRGTGGSGGGDGGSSIDSNGGRTGDARAAAVAVKPEEELKWLNDPRGQGIGAGAAAAANASMDMMNTTINAGVDNDAVTKAEKRVSREVGSNRSNPPVGLLNGSQLFKSGSNSSPSRGDGGGDRFWCGGWKPRCPRREQDGRELGNVVGVPRQAKARDVFMLYDHCGFLGELEESFGREIPPVPRTLEQAELPRVRRRLRFSASAFPRPPKVELEGKKGNGVRADSRDVAAANGAAGAAGHLDDKRRAAAATVAPNGCGAAAGANPAKEKRHEEEDGDNSEELPCAMTSFGSDGGFRVLRANQALRGITRRRRRRSGGGEGDDSPVAEADKGGADEKNGSKNGECREEGGCGLGSPPRVRELGKIVRLWKQPGRRKGVRTVEFAVSVDDGGGEESLARHAPAATGTAAGARRGGLVGSSSACREDDEAQRELFREVSEALRQGLPLWLPVGLVAGDGREIQGYAAVYPLTSSSAEAEETAHPSGTEAYAEMVDEKRQMGDEGGAKDVPLQHALWEFHCVEGSVYLCVSRVVDKLMAALFRKMEDVMLEPAYEGSLSLMQLNQLVDPEQRGDVQTPLGHENARGEGGRGDGSSPRGRNRDGGGDDVARSDRRRALLRLKQLWTLYQVCSQKELQLTSSFSLFHKMRRAPSLDSRRDSRAARSRGEGGGVKGGIPGRIGVSEGIVGISRNIEEETVRFFMSTVRQFLLEIRRGVVMDLLFHVLKGREGDPELGRIVEELVWSSWAVHRDEEVVRLMAEATKLSNAGKFDRSNASLEKVLKIDENHGEVYNRRATNLMLKGRMQEAAADIQKVLAIEPRHFGALRGLGLLRMKLKDYSGALVAFELAVKINPMMLPGLRDNVAVCQAAGNAMLS